MPPTLRPRPHRARATGEPYPPSRPSSRARQTSSSSSSSTTTTTAKPDRQESNPAAPPPSPSPEEEPEEPAAAEQVITSCDYWPEIATHLANRHVNGELAPRLELTCSICRAAALRLPDAIQSNRGGLPAEDLTVAPCGHAFGAPCLRAWLDACFRAGEAPGCPTCRSPLLHEGCQHYFHVRSFGSACLLGLLEQVPVPVPQGGRVPPDCKACRERNVRGATLAALKLMLDGSHVTRDSRMGPEMRENMAFCFAELLTRSIMDAYAVWTESHLEADEWI